MHSERGRLARLLSLIACTALLAACDNDALNTDENTFHIRTLNLVQDSPTLTIDLDDTTIASVGYTSASTFSAGHPGAHDVSFEALLPADLDEDDDDDETSVAVGTATSYTFLNATDYTLIAYGTLADIHTYLVEGLDQREDVADDKLVLQFTHASPAAGTVEVYYTAPEAGVSSRQYAGTLSLSETTSPVTLTLQRNTADLDDDSTLSANVTFELVATATGDTVYRSERITFAEQNRLLFVIADSAGPGPAMSKLVLMGDSTGTYRHRLDGAALKFVHASHDTPALDITVGSGLADPLAQNVGFRQSSAYEAIDDGENGMLAVPTGASSPFVFFEEFTATAGAYYTAYALGPASEVDAVVFSADARSVPTQTTFRFLHGAGSLEEEDSLDVYLRLPGEGVDFDDDETVAGAVLSYQSATNYQTLAAGDYEVYFAYTGTSTIVLGPAPFHVSNGEVTTLVLTDDEHGNLELLPIRDEAI